MVNRNIEFELTKPQEKFFLARTRFVLYGGARGGGKSWAVQRKSLLLGERYPGIRMLLVRRTFPELRGNHILPLLTLLNGIATWKESEKAFNFNNGSRLELGYCATDSDITQYQGQEYDIIFMDEATHFTEWQFTALMACNRGANDFPKRMYLTANPGGPGHAWVKRLFIDRQYIGREKPENYMFIPAKVYDNPFLLEKDPDYVNMLESQPENRRKAWLDGDWDVFEGQYFDMWDENVHVIEPFAIPDWWERYACLDYGRDMFAAYVVRTDPRGRAYVTNEIYLANQYNSDAAQIFTKTFGSGKDFTAVFAPPDLWNRRGDTGRPTAEVFADNGVYLYKAKNDRINGWYDMSEWLMPYVDGETGEKVANLRFFNNCKNVIKCIPLLQFDEKIVNDISKTPHEITHAPDAIRYFVAGRPYPSMEPNERQHWNNDNGSMDSFLHYGR